MTVTITGIEFDRVWYDAEGDVLYLHVGDPATAVDFDASTEGHALRFDEKGRLVGITLLNAAWTLERGGSVVVTTSEGRLEASRGALEPALASRTA
jgi:YD repeat-containing protein